MKLFSRKALVAGAAAVALSFAGTSVAAAEGENPDQTPGVNEEDLNTQDNEAGGETDPNEGGGETDPNEDDDKDKDNGLSSKGDDDKNEGSSDAKEISAWISVFTAVIGALGALFSFASKYLGFKL
ncbi:hypothetical protein [Corynebacterium stationis]|uniref:hypothetical protein n=1 Tax=Corynebacterium stationis TaxID=1705 RepID=UPI00263AC385|nr:hypothetical protein [Corynebacterium stationis]